MGMLHEDPMFDEFARRAMALTPYGGADLGELIATAGQIRVGDLDGWHQAWLALGERVAGAGEASAAAGHAVSARQALLRASTYFRLSGQPFFGAPVDPRMAAASEREREAFARGVEQPAATAMEMVEIPYEGTTLPGCLVLAAGDGPRPTVVFTDGYDGTLQEMWFSDGVAAVAHGYNALLFDGPGQGRNLVRDGLTMRPDWEAVVGPVLDWALERPEVDPSRLVLHGWSLGGFLAPRAAAFESSRLAALVADPGQWDMRDAVVPMLPIDDQAKASFPDIDPALIEPMDAALRSPDADAMLRWRMIGRALWVHGTDTLYEALVRMVEFEVSSVASRITCPTLIGYPEGDRIAAGAPVLFDAISSERKTLVRFTAEEGAGGHCEGLGRQLYHQRVYDWLDETLAA